MSDMLGPASLAVGQSFSAFQFFLPKLSDVRRADPTTDPDIVGDVRMGEAAAIATCIAVGAVISSLTRSSVPMFATAFVATVLVCVYESALRRDKPGNPAGVNRA